MSTTRLTLTGGTASPDVLVAFLGELPFGAFEIDDEATPATVRAYAKTRDVDEAVRDAARALADRFACALAAESLPDVNYNARWEADYAVVEIGDFLRVRAPFHARASGFAYEIELVPEMSFGTGHHATTALMAEYLRDHPPRGREVFDFGTGTGLLALLSAQQGAAGVDATDVDPRCIASTRDNARRNGVALRELRLGTEESLPEGPYDLILANVNRAVLLRAVGNLAARLRPRGQLWLSGILAADVDLVDAAAFDGGLTRRELRRRGEWVACRYDRELTD